MSGDVRSLTDIEAMIARAVEKLGGLDVLVTVVGSVSVRGPFER